MYSEVNEAKALYESKRYERRGMGSVCSLGDMLDQNRPIVVTDPKGELVPLLNEELRKRGYEVREYEIK